jgi:hypothetical protein
MNTIETQFALGDNVAIKNTDITGYVSALWIEEGRGVLCHVRSVDQQGRIQHDWLAETVLSKL